MTVFSKDHVDSHVLAQNNVYTACGTGQAFITAAKEKPFCLPTVLVEKKTKQGKNFDCEAQILLICLISAVASIFLGGGGICAMVQCIHNEPAPAVTTPVNSVRRDAEHAFTHDEELEE